jgi:protein O-GlcNAc transferase
VVPRVEAVPQSVMLLLARRGEHRRMISEVFSRSGVSSDRIRFIERLPPEDYMRRHNVVDLCLDTVPYPGYTTTIDGLFMGVPVITLAGPTAVGRGGVSILSNLGLNWLIAPDEDAYVDIAVRTSENIPALAALRATMRERLRASPLMDAKQFVIDLEEAFISMWKQGPRVS